MYGIVDGQQRLTTIAMTLCALRNALSLAGFMDLADGVHNLIERRDIDNQLQYVLQTESSYPFLQEQILNRESSDEIMAADRTEERRLAQGFAYLSKKINETVKSIDANTTLSAQKKKSAIKSELVKIRDRILSLKIIVTTLETQDDAYTIFETLNARGMDLTITDLVRTLLTRLLPTTNEGVDRAKDRFHDIVQLFETSAANISTRSFLHHYWLSRHEYTTEKKLYKSIKKEVKKRDDAKEFLSSLEGDAKCYRIIHEPSFRDKWLIEENDIRDSLRALNLFQVKQQVPFVLAVMRAYEGSEIAVPLAKRALRAVESFHFIFTAITSQRSSGGISFMYAYHARELQRAKTAESRKAAIQGLVTKLREKLPPYEEFQANFRLLQCSEKFTKRKELVRYILSRFLKVDHISVSPNWEGMTIEHIANQGQTLGSGLSDAEAAEIGNLLLVSEELNTKLGSKSFAAKMKLLERQGMVDKTMSEYDEWSAEAIRERTDHMAKRAFRSIWKIK